MTHPLAIDLFCGLGGWSEGLMAEGYRVIGFDIERHVYGEAQYPAQLVLQDVLTIHGRQFKDAALIVASPPCQEFSYMAMPWTKAKEKARQIRASESEQRRLTQLFDACFRIQREAIKASGRFIPLVVENVCGAQKWVGRARWHFGSFYLWGDVPALMPIVTKYRMKSAISCAPRLFADRVATTPEEAHRLHYRMLKATKNDGGSWFNIAHNTTSGHGQHPARRKTREHLNIRDGHSHTRHLTNPDEHRKNGGDWFGAGADCSLQRRQGSKSNACKAASAHIAKIPLPLARWIGRAWFPTDDLKEHVS